MTAHRREDAVIQGIGMRLAVPKTESGKETCGAIEGPGVSRLYAAECLSNRVFVCDKKAAYLIVTLFCVAFDRLSPNRLCPTVSVLIS